MDKSALYIAVDIGGTKVHVALVRNGIVLQEEKFATAAYPDRQTLLQQIIDTIALFFTADVKGIGVGVPGLVDPERGIVYDLVNIPDWNEVALAELLEAHFSVKVAVANDANLFTLGEAGLGAGKSFRHVLGISLGTGIGMGIYANGQLYSGILSAAGEIGSIPYKDKTIEDYCSSKFFQYQSGKSGEQLMLAAHSGDEEALQIFNDFGQHLGQMINLLLFSFAPQSIIFGGSISHSFALFENSMRQELKKFPFQRVNEQLVIETAQLKNAVLSGAWMLVKQQLEETRHHPFKP